MPAASIARVLVDSPLPQLDRLLDYRVPAGTEGAEPGVRVSVPLRSAGRLAQGFVIERTEQQDYPGPLSDLDAVISPLRVLRPEVWRLARAVADRSAGSASDILRLAVPNRQVRVEKAWIASGPPPAPIVDAPELTGYAPGTLDAALDTGGRVALRVAPGGEPVGGSGSGSWTARWALTLAQAAARVLAGGSTAILVVPDYRDQEQLASALAGLVPPEAIARWDARQPNPDRYRSLLRAGAGPVIVLGTRSAVYAPAERLGLIAVWNDGDPLLGEPLSPYVHAREAALVRQEQQGGALVLAGHTRSTEAQRLVELGYLSEVRPARPRHPRIVPAASAANPAGEDRLAAQARIPSLAWRTATEALKDGPVLVQVARPGYSPGLYCASCGEPARCRRCGGPLRERRRGEAPTCTWCGALEGHWRCEHCRGTALRTAGAGTRRTADELGRAFPGKLIVVSDGEHPQTAVGSRPALVIATRGAEPVAEGGYRAVLLLDGERMVARESLRVGEDVLRWWSDAAALAADDGTVVLTGVGGALAQALATWTQPAYAAAELADRKALGFPPAARSATLRGTPDAIADAVRALPAGAAVVGITEHDGQSRAILRFEYAHGAAVAEAVRAEIIRQATARRKPAPGAPRRGRQPLPLRAHFDDPEPFEE
ncbi:MAG: primosomal protein N' [Microbacteriaceae bacterium]|nr:primosomal protein N' [Microbacteriaceae bacterium]